MIIRRRHDYISRFTWMPVFGTDGKFKEFHATNLRRVARIPIMTLSEAEKSGLGAEQEGEKFLTGESLVQLILGDLEAAYDNIPDDVLERTRKWITASLPRIRIVPKQKRRRCKNPLCKNGPGKGPRKTAALFYPSQSPADPYCSEACRSAHLKNAGFKFTRDEHNNIVARYKKICASCKKHVWIAKSRRQCDKCIAKARKNR